MKKDRAIGFMIAVAIIGIFAGLGMLIYKYNTPIEETVSYSYDSSDESVYQDESSDTLIRETEVAFDDTQRSKDGSTYAEARAELDAIEARYASGTLWYSKNQVPDLYVTNPVTKSHAINKDGDEKDINCCAPIPLYRFNTQTNEYDLVVPDIRLLPGYKEKVSEFTYKDYKHIFSWSQDGRYVYFASGIYEHTEAVGRLFLDTQNLERGFQELPQYFWEGFSNPDRTKAVGIEIVGSVGVDPQVDIYAYYVIDFTTQKITPFFVDHIGGNRLLSYAVESMGYDKWPYLRWLDTDTLVFYTMSEGAVYESDLCMYVDAEEMRSCVDAVIKRNFTTLERHEYTLE